MSGVRHVRWPRTIAIDRRPLNSADLHVNLVCHSGRTDTPTTRPTRNFATEGGGWVKIQSTVNQQDFRRTCTMYTMYHRHI